jgi:hypothetical protein
MKVDRSARRMPSRSFACKGVVLRTSAAHCMRSKTTRFDMQVRVFYVDVTSHGCGMAVQASCATATARPAADTPAAPPLLSIPEDTALQLPPQDVVMSQAPRGPRQQCYACRCMSTPAHPRWQPVPKWQPLCQCHHGSAAAWRSGGRAALPQAMHELKLQPATSDRRRTAISRR